MVFGGYLKVRESLNTWVIIWVNTTFSRIDTREIAPRYEGSCMVSRPEWYWKQKYCQNPYAAGIKQCDFLIIDTWMVEKKDDTRPTLEDTVSR